MFTMECLCKRIGKKKKKKTKTKKKMEENRSCNMSVIMWNWQVETVLEKNNVINLNREENVMYQHNIVNEMAKENVDT